MHILPIYANKVMFTPGYPMLFQVNMGNVGVGILIVASIVIFGASAEIKSQCEAKKKSY